MPNKPQITVIVAVLNGAKTLPRLLGSIASQTSRNFELVVIDGGSTDGTGEIMEAYSSEIAYRVSEPDEGIYDAFNKGLLQARGEWICFLGADDYLWSRDALDKVSPYLSAQEHGLVYGQVALVSQQGEVLLHAGEPWDSAKQKMPTAMSVPHTGMFQHRSWFERYGFFDSAYRIAGDYELLLRGWKEEPVTHVPGLTVAGMTHGGVSSRPLHALQHLKEERCAQRKWIGGPPGLRFLAAGLRVYIRLLLQALLGERLTYRLLDLGRRLSGKPAYWTRI
ncbi:MAG: glycosyltransferase [Gammaproteobacteria bacterium]|nr:glycosyltransferase [Gammaproteobacteria bacterium]MBU1624040.1 glycosyltransferase [Gammaproteobacteria bacterium]MBU1981768.1 glycosyltransferase [Gammaproteobacteria bacterium]